MKSKIVVNILIVYFVILSFVLLVQLTMKEVSAVEPLPSEITAEDRLKNAIVLNVDSPVMLVNEKQFLIDEKDVSVVPIIEDSKIYIPVTVLRMGFNANISFSEAKRETTVRLNNRAIIFYDDNNEIDVIDSTSEQKLEIESKSKIIDGIFYIPLRTFAEIFEKEIFVYNDLIIISNMEDIFDPTTEIDIILEIANKVNYLPIVGNQDNLKKLINQYKLTDDEDKKEIEYLIKEEFNFQSNDDKFEEDNQILDEIDEITLEDDEALEELETEEVFRHFIKNIERFNFYVNEEFLEVFILETDNEEFSFKVQLLNDKLVDIILKDDKLILTYYTEDITQISIYNILDKENIEHMGDITTNGAFYKNILNGDYIFTLTKLNAKSGEMSSYSIQYYEEYYTDIDLSNVFYFPDINDREYTIISAINLNYEEEIKTYMFFGMGEKIIIDNEYLYIITNSNEKTNIYAYKLNFGEFEYIKRVSLKGKVLEFSDIILDSSFITIKTTEEEKIYTKALMEK